MNWNDWLTIALAVFVVCLLMWVHYAHGWFEEVQRLLKELSK